MSRDVFDLVNKVVNRYNYTSVGTEQETTRTKAAPVAFNFKKKSVIENSQYIFGTNGTPLCLVVTLSVLYTDNLLLFLAKWWKLKGSLVSLLAPLNSSMLG